MNLRWTRAAIFAGALLMLLAGVSSVLVSTRSLPVRAQSNYPGNTIEILPGSLGFNPRSCQLNRNGSSVRFVNTDRVPRRLVVLDPYDPTPEEPTYLFDTGELAPGAFSNEILANGPIDVVYRDFANPNLTVRIYSPVSNSAPDDCKPQPPTPTPTNTPRATATPTPTQRPAGCARFFASPQGCAVAPQVANDEPRPTP